MEKGNVNSALLLLTNNTINEILPLSNETLQLLHLKYPKEKQAHNEASFQGLIKQVHIILHDDTDEGSVMKVAIKTKGGCGASGFVADNWCRILGSKSFSSCSLGK